MTEASGAGIAEDTSRVIAAVCDDATDKVARRRRANVPGSAAGAISAGIKLTGAPVAGGAGPQVAAAADAARPPRAGDCIGIATAVAGNCALGTAVWVSVVTIDASIAVGAVVRERTEATVVSRPLVPASACTVGPVAGCVEGVGTTVLEHGARPPAVRGRPTEARGADAAIGCEAGVAIPTGLVLPLIAACAVAA